MKYYLLTFKDYYADECNVFAQACFNETDCQNWYEFSISKINENYEKEVEEFKIQLAARRAYDEACLKVTRGLSSNEPVYAKYVHSSWGPKKGESCLQAYLGNFGECFGEDFNHLSFGKDLVDAGKVKVVEVTEEFYTIFNNNKLHELSMCNVFDIYSNSK